MLMEYSGEGAQCQAAKLLEVIVLQYRGEIDRVRLSFYKYKYGLCKFSEMVQLVVFIILASRFMNERIYWFKESFICKFMSGKPCPFTSACLISVTSEYLQ